MRLITYKDITPPPPPETVHEYVITMTESEREKIERTLLHGRSALPDHNVYLPASELAHIFRKREEK